MRGARECVECVCLGRGDTEGAGGLLAHIFEGGGELCLFLLENHALQTPYFVAFARIRTRRHVGGTEWF